MDTIDYGSQTVLITGASSGIGAEFARALAERGSDVVLVARRLERLERLANELSADYGVRATPIAMDLTAPSVGAKLDRACAERGLRVTSVVNNAGFATNRYFHEADHERLMAEIALNVTGLVDISRTFAGRLRESGGFVVNVASMAAYQAAPLMAVYGAAKAFVLSFTEALWYESRGTGMRVLALCPGATETEFFDVAGERASGGRRRMPAAAVVATALRALDRRSTPPSVVAGRLNRVAASLGRLVSRRRLTMAVGRIMADGHRAERVTRT
ncbi:SDR family NAD(P)-dependent oxidoreductase [Glycomyces tarimensis]